MTMKIQGVNEQEERQVGRRREAGLSISIVGERREAGGSPHKRTHLPEAWTNKWADRPIVYFLM